MKIVYWYAQCLKDAEEYSVRERTKKAAIAAVNERGADEFGPVKKVELEYANSFDLLTECMSESRGWWEA